MPWAEVIPVLDRGGVLRDLLFEEAPQYRRLPLVCLLTGNPDPNGGCLVDVAEAERLPVKI